MTKVLVTGASGQLGRGVIAHLLKDGKLAAADIVAASRNPDKLADIAAQGIETRAADFNDPAGLETAFAGIDRILLISTDELAAPGKRLEQHKAAVAAAVKAGVKHIVYTSMPNPDKSLISFAPDHLGTEEAIKASGLRYTILRNSWYTENHFMGLPHALQAGVWYTSQAGGRLPNICRDDCAAAAAAALASPPAESVVMTLTGSESLTAEQIAEIVSTLTGKPLAVVQVSDEQLAGGVRAAGMPEFVVQLVVSADANIREGNFDLVTDDFERLTGRKPQSVAAFFAAHKAALG
ncbi:SDR family oxidoreductase [Rhizobium sp. CSW-27]|uniref:SDR family oxidoreductase n=1 Tax=Rhizobium sp. CSW-27 TaxID=2839985 RepID=UPI001C02EB09|nr:SDR family oxidoreductase [Rhizobium sp. CSW-27]MBT9370968.1 SDR family oxidoreductase [Rhizobium sp. CSW-27]